MISWQLVITLKDLPDISVELLIHSFQVRRLHQYIEQLSLPWSNLHSVSHSHRPITRLRSPACVDHLPNTTWSDPTPHTQITHRLTAAKHTSRPSSRKFVTFLNCTALRHKFYYASLHVQLIFKIISLLAFPKK